MLANTLERLADLLEKQRALRSSVISALIYPAILLVAGISSIVLLLTQVLPQFVPMFEQAGATLPRPTLIVIALGHFVSAYGLYTAVLLAILVIMARQALLRPNVRLAWDRTLLRLPIAGALARELLGRTLRPHARHACCRMACRWSAPSASSPMSSATRPPRRR